MLIPDTFPRYPSGKGHQGGEVKITWQGEGPQGGKPSGERGPLLNRRNYLSLPCGGTWYLQKHPVTEKRA